MLSDLRVSADMSSVRAAKPFLQPLLDSTDDDDDDFQPERPRNLRRNVKNGDGQNGAKTTTGRSNGASDSLPRMAKNPLADSDSDLEEIVPELPIRQPNKTATKKPPHSINNKRPPPPPSRKKKTDGSKKAAKRRRKVGDSNSDDEDFDPGSDDDEEEGSDEEGADEESVRSEDLSLEENISDSDFNPSDEAEEEVGNSHDETIQLSSDGECSVPDKSGVAKGGRENIQTFDPNSTVRHSFYQLIFLRKICISE